MTAPAIPPPPEQCPRCGEREVEQARTPGEAYCNACGVRIAYDSLRGEWLIP